TAVGTFKAATVSLTINGSTTPASIVHGSSATAVVTVASTTTGTPTGDVSLIAPTTTNGGIGEVTLSGGTKTFSTTLLPGGTYSVTAHYAGDGTFAPRDSNAVPVMVTPESSKLQIGILTFDASGKVNSNPFATTFPYGSPYILRMDILNSTGTSTNCLP